MWGVAQTASCRLRRRTPGIGESGAPVQENGRIPRSARSLVGVVLRVERQDADGPMEKSALGEGRPKSQLRADSGLSAAFALAVATAIST